MTNKDRWQVAVHESAHGVAAIALGGTCSQLSVHSDGGGMAFIRGLIPFDNAVAVAAPKAASEILGDVQAPAIEPTTELLDVRTSVADLTPREKLANIAARFPPHSTPTDEQVIAAYCINGVEHEHERWAERYHLVHHIAYQVVRNHRDQILRVARELFMRGVLSQDEIKRAIQ